MRRPRSPWANPVQEDAGIAEVEIGFAQPSLPQRGQPRPGQLEVPDAEAAGVLARGFAEAGAEQAPRRGRRLAVGDEVDFVHEPVEAFDGEDLQVISTHLQDAAVKPVDMAFRPREKRFALVVDRDA